MQSCSKTRSDMTTDFDGLSAEIFAMLDMSWLPYLVVAWVAIVGLWFLLTQD